MAESLIPEPLIPDQNQTVTGRLMNGQESLAGGYCVGGLFLCHYYCPLLVVGRYLRFVSFRRRPARSHIQSDLTTETAFAEHF